MFGRQDLRGTRRHTAALLACFAALAVAQPATAAPKGQGKGKGAPKAKAKIKAGALDRSFHRDGKVVAILPEPANARPYTNYRLPFEFAPGHITMATAPGGKVVIASSKAIVRYLADGRPDPSFGGNGAVPIEGLEGARFQLADVAVDSKGSVVIAGTTRATSGIGMEGKVAGPIPSMATIRRYKANGQPDEGFDGNGVISTYFGAPKASHEGTSYAEPAVSLIGLAIDRQDRLVVTGSSVAEVGLCGPNETRYETSHAFIARRTSDGGPDPTFAGGATEGFRELSWLGLPTPTAAGPVFGIGMGVATPCGTVTENAPSIVVGSAPGGGPAGSFGSGGLWSRPYTRVSDVAAAPGGKIVLLKRTVELSGGEWVESVGEVVRLRGNGSFDTGFGRRGVAEVTLPKNSALGAITVDPKGRVLLAGTFAKKVKGVKRSQLRFMLIRATATGEADERFGRGGRVTTAFGSRANVRASDVLVDKEGRITVGGKFSGPTSSDAFALARYLGR